LKSKILIDSKMMKGDKVSNFSNAFYYRCCFNGCLEYSTLSPSPIEPLLTLPRPNC
jgi:hypothetical protein